MKEGQNVPTATGIFYMYQKIVGTELLGAIDTFEKL